MHELKNIEDPLMKKVDFLSLINLRQIKLDADLIQHFADSFADVIYVSTNAESTYFILCSRSLQKSSKT